MVDVLYEDKNIVVCDKPYGLDSQSQMVETLSKQLNCKILPVHRLDKIVCGLMVYAKNQNACSKLTSQITSNQFSKEYLTIVSGHLENESGQLTDYLYHDKNKNKTFVVKKERKGVKKAILNYEVLDTNDNSSLLRIELLTGRTHQIRAQLANINHPILGDGKYGSKVNQRIALYCYKISFNNLDNSSKMTFERIASSESFSSYKTYLNKMEEN